LDRFRRDPLLQKVGGTLAVIMLAEKACLGFFIENLRN
jgi:hypothetical protein